MPPEACRPGWTGKELALRDMWSHLITSVCAIESCLRINHSGQPRPEGILLSSASFFHTEGGSQSRDSVQFKTETFLDNMCYTFCHTVHIYSSCIGTRDMTI